MSDQSKYDEYVTASILAKNQFDISLVQNLKSIKSVYFNYKDYSELEQLIIQQNFEAITDLGGCDVPRQYLEVMEYEDQKSKQYIVSVYDSDELWQNPEAIKIYPKK